MRLHGLGVLLLSAVLAFPATIAKHSPDDKHHSHKELVKQVRKRLLPSFSDSTMHGPEDVIYYPLSQAQIDDLLRFHYDRREVFPYIMDTWDCDDAAREFFHLSRVWNIRRNGANTCVPAVGAAYVHIHGPYDLIQGSPVVEAYHVLNVILRDDGQWFFYEPQSAKLLPIEGPVLFEQSITVQKIQI